MAFGLRPVVQQGRDEAVPNFPQRRLLLTARGTTQPARSEPSLGQQCYLSVDSHSRPTRSPSLLTSFAGAFTATTAPPSVFRMTERTDSIMPDDVSSRSSAADKVQSVPYKQLGKQFVQEFKDDDVMGLASEVAYHLIFAIPPLLLLTVTVAALLNRFTNLPVVENLRQLATERAPENLQEVLDTIITNAVEQVSGGLISVGLLTTTVVALWSASNGIASIMKAYNRAYDVRESRPYLKKRLVAVGLALLMVVLINAAFALFVFGEHIGSWIANWLGFGTVFETVWGLARWPIAIFLFMFLLAVLYYLAPNTEQSFRWISPGSVVATIFWIAAVFGFQLYLRFADPGSAYGAFSSVIVFLFFLFITSVILLIGAQVNAILQKRYDESVVRDRAAHPERLEDDAAREEAGKAGAAFEQREGKGIDNRSAQHIDAKRNQPRQPASRPERESTRPLIGGVWLAIVGTVVGWFFGRRRRDQ